MSPAEKSSPKTSINIAAAPATIGEARLVAYSAAKAGAAGFVRAIAREAGGLTVAEARRFDRLRDNTPAEPVGFE